LGGGALKNSTSRITQIELKSTGCGQVGGKKLLIDKQAIDTPGDKPKFSYSEQMHAFPD